jgi:hypothetical protein
LDDLLALSAFMLIRHDECVSVGFRTIWFVV